MLNELRGSPIADDPLEFSRLKPKERYDLLKSLVPGFDFDAQAKARQELFDDRTDVGRAFDRAKGAAESIEVPPNAPERSIDVTQLAAPPARSASARPSGLTAGRRGAPCSPHETTR